MKVRHANPSYNWNEKLYRVWGTMKSRCNNPKHDKYKYYGAKGVKVCELWTNSYAEFRKWSYENGYADGMSIERLDNGKGYCPENCTYIPLKDQHINQSYGNQITIDGVTKNTLEWAQHYKISYKTVQYRIHGMGWDPIKALTEPCEYKIAVIKKDVLELELSKSGMYRYDLARESKIDATALSKKISGKRDFMQDEAERICEVLKIADINKLFDIKTIQSSNSGMHKNHAVKKVLKSFKIHDYHPHSTHPQPTTQGELA